MFCPKCGNPVADGETICSNCNDSQKEVGVVPEKTEKIGLKSDNIEVEKKVMTPKLIIFSLIAVVVLFMFLIAAKYISTGGVEIMSIQSVAGNSIEEAYYYNLGSIYAGYALIARALGFFFSAVLVWLGISK